MDPYCCVQTLQQPAASAQVRLSKDHALEPFPGGPTRLVPAPFAQASSAMDVDAPAGAAPMATAAAAGGLHNSASVQSAWCKLFRLVVNQVRLWPAWKCRR